MSSNRPVVLCFSGHDPSGGAGIQADIEVLISHRCHAATVITALTEQDTQNVRKVIPQTVTDFNAQALAILNDLPVKVIKIGLIGSVEIALVLQEILQSYPNIPVVLDPVLAAGGGASVSNESLRQAIVERLLPLTFIATPNSKEARQLAQLDDLNACGKALLKLGCQNVLITGAHEETRAVRNQLFRPELNTETFTWERLPHSYHGSGCTLASSIAALLAHDLDCFVAVNEAQEYTWNSLNKAYQSGQGQRNPNRFFWVDDES